MSPILVIAVVFAIVMAIASKPNRHGEPPREQQFAPEINDAMFGCSTFVWILIVLAVVLAVAQAFGMASF
jgi:hypothetical protein